MKVVPIHREPTRYWVESSSLECPRCGRLFSRTDPRWSSLEPSTACPRCSAPAPGGHPGGVPTLKTRWHLVDIAVHWPVGQCACEAWQFTLKPRIERMSESELAALTQQRASDLRCPHIRAARAAALDLTVRSHEEERLRNGHGRTEEQAP